MNLDFDDLPLLEEPCGCLDGKVWPCNGPISQTCEGCRGTSQRLTEFGKAVVDVVSRHMNLPKALPAPAAFAESASHSATETAESKPHFRFLENQIRAYLAWWKLWLTEVASVPTTAHDGYVFSENLLVGQSLYAMLHTQFRRWRHNLHGGRIGYRNGDEVVFRDLLVSWIDLFTLLEPFFTLFSQSYRSLPVYVLEAVNSFRETKNAAERLLSQWRRYESYACTD